MVEPDWASRLTSTVAGELRRYRLSRNMSVQQLSDHLTAFGVPMARPVLSNLENGRRPNVTVAELFALASVLQVPPLLLLFPLGRASQVEITPDVATDPWHALQWALGQGLEDDESKAPEVADPAVSLFENHDKSVRYVERAWHDLMEAREGFNAVSAGREPSGSDGRPMLGGPRDTSEALMMVEHREIQLSRTASELRQTRKLLRSHDREPPGLSERVATIIEEQPAR